MNVNETARNAVKFLHVQITRDTSVEKNAISKKGASTLTKLTLNDWKSYLNSKCYFEKLK